jgi:poly(A) polymerase
MPRRWKEHDAMKERATQVVRTLQQAGFEAYFAGGGVRDQLLGMEPKDIDIATNASPDQVQKLFPRVTGLEGKCFGVVRVLLDSFTYEVATFRRDGPYQDGRRPEYVQFTSAEEDARRRDFTINGLFYDPVRDKLIDFVGGQADLEARLIRAIGDPVARFNEDKLRLLRAVRFAANLPRKDRKPFIIETNTWAAIQKSSPQIAQVAIERIREELDKIWAGARPEHGLDLLDQSGLLAVVLPEIDRLHGVEQPPQFHPEGDVYQHVRMMLSKLHYAPLPLALSVLFHDVAKPHTYKVDETGRIRFSGHEAVGARVTEEIMTRMRYSNETIRQTVALVENHMTFKDVKRMRMSTLKRLMGRDTFELELELHRIDCLCCHGDLENYHFLKQKQQELPTDEIKPSPLISGHDVLSLGVPPGKAIGTILTKVYEAQLEGSVTTHNEAIALASKLANDF